MPDVDLEVKLAVYRHFAGTARRPSAGEIGATLGLPGDEVLASFRRLGLAKAWYSTRLRLDSRRPQPDEIRSIFGRLGLTDDFWDPRADTFG